MQKISKQDLGEYAPFYDDVTELVNAISSLTSGQLTRGDGDKATADIWRLLARGTRARRSSTAAVAAPENCSRRLKVFYNKVYRYMTKALLDSGAVPSRIS